jgi:hypothetical protein
MNTMSMSMGRGVATTAGATTCTARSSSTAARTIAWGTVVVAALDMAECQLYYSNLPFLALYRGVAKGLLGDAARSGGLAAALLGALLHLFICFVIVLTYYGASRRIPALARRPVVWGLAYGVWVFAFMNYLVVPLSAAGSFDRLPLSIPFLLNGIIGQALVVGLPAALFARRALAGSKPERHR